MTADLKIVKRLQRMVIIEGEDGFDLVTSPAYVQLGPLCWQAIGRQLRDPALNLETKGEGLTWPDAEALALKADRFFTTP